MKRSVFLAEHVAYPDRVRSRLGLLSLAVMILGAACSSENRPDPGGFDPNSISGKWLSPKGSLPGDTGLILDLDDDPDRAAPTGSAIWLHGSRAEPGELEDLDFAGGELRFRLPETSIEDGRVTITFYAASFLGTLSEDGRRITGTLSYQDKEEMLYLDFERVIRPPEVIADWVRPIGLPSNCAPAGASVSNGLTRLADLGSRLGLSGRFIDVCTGNGFTSRDSSFVSATDGVRRSEERLQLFENIGGEDRPIRISHLEAGPEEGLVFIATLPAHPDVPLRVETHGGTLFARTASVGPSQHVGLGLLDGAGTPLFLSSISAVNSEYDVHAVRYLSTLDQFIVITRDDHVVVDRGGQVRSRAAIGAARDLDIANAAILNDGTVWVTGFHEPGVTITELPAFSSETGHFLAKLDASGRFLLAMGIDESIGQLAVADDGGALRLSPYRLARHDQNGAVVFEDETLGSPNAGLSIVGDTVYVFDAAIGTGILEREGQYFDAPQHLFALDAGTGAMTGLVRVPGEPRSMRLLVRADRSIFVAGEFRGPLSYEGAQNMELPATAGLETDVFVGRFRFPSFQAARVASGSW